MSVVTLLVIILLLGGLIWKLVIAPSASKAQAPVVAPPVAALPVKAAPQGPPLSDAEFQTFLDWQEANALPAITLTPTGKAPETPGGSRIGGPVWLPKAEAWPKGKDGEPMSFLAQIDFASLPPLPDYPTSGVLQFFIGRDDLYGADFEAPEKGNFRVIWRETLDGPGALHRAAPATSEGADDYSPLYPELIRNGVALTGQLMRQNADIGYWKLGEELGPLLDRDYTNRIYSHVDAILNGGGDVHHVGGHPWLTQSDFRNAKYYGDVDRVLLQLWSDNRTGLMWGDMGQGNFMIRRADLLKRDFSRVTYHWDCY